MPETKSLPITAYLDELLVGKLTSISKADDRSMSWLIGQAAREFIAKPENVAKWMEHKNAQVDITEQIARKIKGPRKPK